jgi:hypothetical protein
MVWGAVWYGGRSELIIFDKSQSEGKRKGVTAAIYRDQITKGELKRVWNRVHGSWRAYGGARILEDNVRIHTSAINRDVGAKQRFLYVDHPPYSPDLNPIENIWAYLKKQLNKIFPRPTSITEMAREAQRIWKEIPQEVIDNCCISMGKRLEAVRLAKGGPTKY